jgi:mersacidin/lichenicidin family type 2 lantibiotic
MSKHEIIRAWLDEEYRESLTGAQRAALPGHPAGLVELDESLLNAITGGRTPLKTTMECHSYRTDVAGCGGCPGTKPPRPPEG